MQYSISEAATLLGVAPSTLRFYDREGLLPFVSRTPGGMRYFEEADIPWLKMIGCLKAAGMPLKDIRKYIQMAMQGNETVEARLALFQAQREAILAQIEQLQRTLDVVEYKCWFYEIAVSTGDESIPKNMPMEEIPARFQSVRHNLRGTMGGGLPKK